LEHSIFLRLQALSSDLHFKVNSTPNLLGQAFWLDRYIIAFLKASRLYHLEWFMALSLSLLPLSISTFQERNAHRRNTLGFLDGVLQSHSVQLCPDYQQYVFSISKWLCHAPIENKLA